MRFKLFYVLFFFFLPALCFADSSLHFKVTNHSKLLINFGESGFFTGFGTNVYPNQTGTNRYKQEKTVIKFHLTQSTDFYKSMVVSIDGSCEAIGIPPYYQKLTGREDSHLDGQPVLYRIGNVHVTIEELPDSTPLFHHIICKVDKT